MINQPDYFEPLFKLLKLNIEKKKGGQRIVIKNQDQILETIPIEKLIGINFLSFGIIYKNQQIFDKFQEQYILGANNNEQLNLFKQFAKNLDLNKKESRKNFQQNFLNQFTKLFNNHQQIVQANKIFYAEQEEDYQKTSQDNEPYLRNLFFSAKNTILIKEKAKEIPITIRADIKQEMTDQRQQLVEILINFLDEDQLPPYLDQYIKYFTAQLLTNLNTQKIDRFKKSFKKYFQQNQLLDNPEADNYKIVTEIDLPIKKLNFFMKQLCHLIINIEVLKKMDNNENMNDNAFNEVLFDRFYSLFNKTKDSLDVSIFRDSIEYKKFILMNPIIFLTSISYMIDRKVKFFIAWLRALSRSYASIQTYLSQDNQFRNFSERIYQIIDQQLFFINMIQNKEEEYNANFFQKTLEEFKYHKNITTLTKGKVENVQEYLQTGFTPIYKLINYLRVNRGTPVDLNLKLNEIVLPTKNKITYEYIYYIQNISTLKIENMRFIDFCKLNDINFELINKLQVCFTYCINYLIQTTPFNLQETIYKQILKKLGYNKSILAYDLYFIKEKPSEITVNPFIEQGQNQAIFGFLQKLLINYQRNIVGEELQAYFQIQNQYKEVIQKYISIEQNDGEFELNPLQYPRANEPQIENYNDQINKNATTAQNLLAQDLQNIGVGVMDYLMVPQLPKYKKFVIKNDTDFKDMLQNNFQIDNFYVVFNTQLGSINKQVYGAYNFLDNILFQEAKMDDLDEEFINKIREFITYTIRQKTQNIDNWIVFIQITLRQTEIQVLQNAQISYKYRKLQFQLNSETFRFFDNEKLRLILKNFIIKINSRFDDYDDDMGLDDPEYFDKHKSEYQIKKTLNRPLLEEQFVADNPYIYIDSITFTTIIQQNEEFEATQKFRAVLKRGLKRGINIGEEEEQYEESKSQIQDEESIIQELQPTKKQKKLKHIKPFCELTEQFTIEQYYQDFSIKTKYYQPEQDCYTLTLKRLEMIISNNNIQQNQFPNQKKIPSLKQLIVEILDLLIQYQNFNIKILILYTSIEDLPDYSIYDILQLEQGNIKFSYILNQEQPEEYLVHELYNKYYKDGIIKQDQLTFINTTVIVQGNHCYLADQQVVQKLLTYINQAQGASRAKKIIQIQRNLTDVLQYKQGLFDEKVVREAQQLAQKMNEEQTESDHKKIVFQNAQKLYTQNREPIRDLVNQKNKATGGYIISNKVNNILYVQNFQIGNMQKKLLSREISEQLQLEFLKSIRYDQKPKKYLQSKQEGYQAILAQFGKNFFEQSILPRQFPSIISQFKSDSYQQDKSYIVFDIETTSSSDQILIPLFVACRIKFFQQTLKIYQGKKDQQECKEFIIDVPEFLKKQDYCFGIKDNDIFLEDNEAENYQNQQIKSSCLLRMLIWFQRIQNDLWTQVIQKFKEVYKQDAEKIFLQNLNYIKKTLQIIVLGFNSSGFDLPLILPYLIQLSNDKIQILGDLGRIKVLIWGLFTFQDIFLTISSSLKAACKSLLPEEENFWKDENFNIVEKGHTIELFKQNYDEIKKYCIQDLVATEKVFQTFSKSLKLTIQTINKELLQYVKNQLAKRNLPQISEQQEQIINLYNFEQFSEYFQPTTISSAAQILFNCSWGFYNIVQEKLIEQYQSDIGNFYQNKPQVFYTGTQNKNIHKIECLSYKGGLTKVLNYSKLTNGYYLDVNSLYPSILAGKYIFDEDFLIKMIGPSQYISKPSKYLKTYNFYKTQFIDSNTKLWSFLSQQSQNIQNRNQQQRNLFFGANRFENIKQYIKPHNLYTIPYYTFKKNKFIPFSIKTRENKNYQFRNFNAVRYFLHMNAYKNESKNPLQTIQQKQFNFSVNYNEYCYHVWGLELLVLLYNDSFEDLFIYQEHQYSSIDQDFDLYGKSIEILYRKRLEAKQTNPAAAQIMKLIMNSSYGVFGYKERPSNNLMSQEQYELFVQKLLLENNGDFQQALQKIKSIDIHQTILDYKFPQNENNQEQIDEIYSFIKLDGFEQELQQPVQNLKNKKQVRFIRQLFEENGLQKALIQIKTDKEYHPSQKGSLTFLASATTSYARSVMTFAINKIGVQNVYYMDTDSIIVNSEGYQNALHLNIINNELLGYFKNEIPGDKSFEYFTAFAPKIYQCSYLDAKQKQCFKNAFKGVKKPDQQTFQQLLDFGQVIVKNQSRILKKQVGVMISVQDFQLEVKPVNKTEIDENSGQINYFENIDSIYNGYEKIQNKIGLIIRDNNKFKIQPL